MLIQVELYSEDLEMEDVFYDAQEEQLPVDPPVSLAVPALVVPTTSPPAVPFLVLVKRQVVDVNL
jgi:hypothetical protein